MKSKILLAVALLLLCIDARSQVRELKVLFWFPGGAGSTLEAQPLLDIFSEYVNGKSDHVKISTTYMNDAVSGLRFIKEKKPEIVIASHAAWAQHKHVFDNSMPILATLPLPGGKDTERYHIYGKGPSDGPIPSKLISSEPFSDEYLKTQLFPSIGRNVSSVQTSQIMLDLKRIADGQLKAAAVLTPVESATLLASDFAWAKSLAEISESEEIPSPRVFSMEHGDGVKASISDILMMMSTENEGSEILAELRLKGFVRIK